MLIKILVQKSNTYSKAQFIFSREAILTALILLAGQASEVFGHAGGSGKMTLWDFLLVSFPYHFFFVSNGTWKALKFCVKISSFLGQNSLESWV